MNRARLRNGSTLLVVPAAALVVHQLRYMLAYGSRAGAELASQGHSYLHSLVPWMILALGVPLSSFLRRAVRAARSGDAGRLSAIRPSLLWGATTVGLVAVYVLQEGLEELFASGHPTGTAGIVGHGGWWAVPAAAAVAAAVVALLRVGRVVLRLAARLAVRPRRLRPSSIRLPAAAALAVTAPLALAAAGRAPPAV